ncbi:TraB/GumN family protein [Rhodalgimonas zhirmunskyi]|uniref:TraB/GumN family protein n=1 Tax=Rhodalgimonas zhirmunskyi TaxID=2964767 RepID=A0AAJ1UAT9_9RHOB|nr:TraB/GumN family protein [Rhodoalgimonas zhirmunskyi]MDQ2095055.1 TraB/GumN family protein [Rhodoalgimonas zhirmunskyi]
MRYLLFFLLLLANPASALARAFDCTGRDILHTLPQATQQTITQAAAETPYATGLLWQAEKDGARITLFGTYHVPHASTQNHFDTLMPMARTADVVFFEMSAPDQAEFEKTAATDASLLFITDGPTLPELLPEESWQELRRQMSERGMPSFMTAKFKPIYVSMLLGMSPCQLRQQQAGQVGIDGRLSKALASEGKDTRSIEDPMATLALFDNFTQAEQIAMIEMTLALPLSPDDLQETMYRLYADGETARLWEFGRALTILYGGPTGAADFAKMEQALLTNRNRAWTAPLEAAARPGTSVFAAFGAGHLPGKDGVLNLLAQNGWTITRLPLARPSLD